MTTSLEKLGQTRIISFHSRCALAPQASLLELMFRAGPYFPSSPRHAATPSVMVTLPAEWTSAMPARRSGRAAAIRRGRAPIAVARKDEAANAERARHRIEAGGHRVDRIVATRGWI